MFEFQSHLIFPTHAVPRAGPWPEGAERLSLKSAGGEDLAGIRIPPEHASDDRTLILGFGGNGWNAQDVAEYLHELFPDEEVVTFHYRGYSPSKGSPSADALIADAPLIYDFAVEKVKPRRIIGVGFSIGTGVAARLAAVRPLDGLILGFGGNGWNAQDVAEYLHELFPDEEVVTFHYRGYSPSKGSPSADALTADAPLIYDFAVAKVKPRRIIGIGFSIGTGVAARLAAVRPLDGLILVTPFDSLKAVAQGMYPWLPIGLFFEHEINAAAALERLEIPVAIIGAERDEIVAPDRTEALRKRVRQLVFDRTIVGAGHNDIYAKSDFRDAMQQAFKRLKV